MLYYQTTIKQSEERILNTITPYITSDIQYIGVNDHKVDLFEGQYVVPKGMAYNSYVIFDENYS